MTIDVSANVAATTILERSVCLRLHCGVISNNRRVKLSTLSEVLAGDDGSGDSDDAAKPSLDEQHFHATMRLVNPKKIAPVKRIQSQAKSYLRSIGIASHGAFGLGTTLVPIDKVIEADERLTQFASALAVARKSLADGYLEAMAEQARGLGPAFDASRYPSPEDVEKAFTLDWWFIEFKSPDKLDSVSAAIARANNRKYQERLVTAFDETVAILRGEALSIMSDLEERLAPTTADGKPKSIRGTVLRDLQQFIANLPSRNMVDDDALVRTLDRVTNLARGLSAETVKSSDALRSELREAAAEAKAALAGLVSSGRRAIAFDGLDVEIG